MSDIKDDEIDDNLPEQGQDSGVSNEAEQEIDPFLIPTQDELSVLKKRADQMGLKYHPNIGLDKLKKKVADTLNGVSDSEPEPEVKTETPLAATRANPGSVPHETKLQMQTRLRKDATKLIRIKVACMNPNKKEWEGEIFTVSNSVVGTIKKYVPFNNEEGWHVPYMIYNMMKERQCQIFQKKRDKTGVSSVHGKLINEFSIEVMPPLNKDELNDLAQRQAMSSGTTT